MQARLWSLNGLAVELGQDRRTLARKLEGLDPDEEKRQGRRTVRQWRLARVIEHLYRGDGALDAVQERARKDKEGADRLAMENAVRRGELVELNVYIVEHQKALMELRSAFLAFPMRLTPHLDGDPLKNGQLLKEAVYDLLTRLADEGDKARAVYGGTANG
jgi:phage terminase Nu1 subunit (DNA packaging protein)